MMSSSPDSPEDDCNVGEQLSKGREKAMAKRKEFFEGDDDSDEEDEEISPPRGSFVVGYNASSVHSSLSQSSNSNGGTVICSPWSQEQFAQLMKIHNEREAQKRKAALPVLTTPSSLVAKPIDLARVVEQAEVATGLKAKKASKRKTASKPDEETKKQAHAEKKMKKQEEKAAKEKEAARLAQVRLEIEVFVDRFQPEYYNCLEVQEEKKPGDKEDKDYSVVKWFYVKKGKPEEKKYDINDFTIKHLRKLAGKCNVKGYSTLSIWNCRTNIAAFVTAGTMYKESSIANPFTDATQRRTNTFMRIINVCFSKNLVQRFVDLNDRKKREQYEEAHGGDPVKAFFVEASNTCNDASLNGTLSKICASEEGEDIHLSEWVASGTFNLSDFDPQTYATCYSKAYDLLKAREIALDNMTISGEHDSDFWNFCTRKCVLKWQQNGTELPAQAVYYCHIMCLQFPAIDGKFADRLHEGMKSDSNIPMVGEAGGGGAGKDRKLTKGEREMMKRMDEASQQQKEASDRSYKQREEFIALQKRMNEDNTKRANALETRESWKEYITLGKEFKAFIEEGDSDNNPLLKNLAKRLKALETQLKIDEADSVTQAFFLEE
jgi:hypothetical protein